MLYFRWFRFRYVLIFGIITGLALLWRAGSLLISPFPTTIGEPPVDLPAERVSFTGIPGEEIVGWYLRGEPGRGAVLLLHGVGANRLIMVPRARFLQKLGYSVLLIDFRAHGESSGDNVTFGFLEAKDVEASIKYLKQLVPGEKIGAIGLSLGGASLILAHQPLEVDAVVLESVFPTIELASEHRLIAYFGWFTPIVNKLLLLQLPLRLGINLSDLHPIQQISKINRPVLIASGIEDKLTTISESKAMCDAAREPKECWWVNGAAHVDLYEYVKPEYEQHLQLFFEKYLRSAQ